MTVNSLYFLLFLVAACFIYYVVPLKMRWMVLLAASAVFYVSAGSGSPLYLLLTSIIVYLAGWKMDQIDAAGKGTIAELQTKIRALSKEDASADEKNAGKATTSSADAKTAAAEAKTAIAGMKAAIAETKAAIKQKKKNVLTAAVVMNLAILVILKYSRLLLLGANAFSGIFGIKFALPSFVQPLGISYYTLIAIGYLMDIYKGRITAQKNYAKLLLFLGYFPQMTQGPMNRYSTTAPYLYEGHRLDYHNISYGCQRLLWGLFKKFVVADRMSPVVSALFGNFSELSSITCFLCCIYMTVWMYADFSGYMDIVLGASELFGVPMEENFKRPFFAKSLAEYWRRWHISLSTWFRDYMFYPLALSKPAIQLGKKGRKWFGIRVGKLFPSLYAMVFVWFCTGLWHDASVRYVLWGVANGVFMMGAMVLEPYFTKAKNALHIKEESKGWQLFSMVRTFLLVCLLKVFPGPSYTMASMRFIKALFTHWWRPSGWKEFYPELDSHYLPVLFVSLLVMFIVDVIQEKQPVRDVLAKRNFAVRWLIYFLLIAAILYFGTFDTLTKGGFAYAQF